MMQKKGIGVITVVSFLNICILGLKKERLKTESNN